MCGMGGGVLVKTSANQPKQLFLTFPSPTSMTNYCQPGLREENTNTYFTNDHTYFGCHQSQTGDNCDLVFCDKHLIACLSSSQWYQPPPFACNVESGTVQSNNMKKHMKCQHMHWTFNNKRRMLITSWREEKADHRFIWPITLSYHLRQTHMRKKLVKWRGVGVSAAHKPGTQYWIEIGREQ